MSKKIRIVGWVVLLVLSVVSVVYLNFTQWDKLGEVSAAVGGMEVEVTKHVVETLRKVVFVTFH